MEQIKALDLPDLLEVRAQLDRLVSQISPPQATSDEEFEAALQEITGCTAGSGSMNRLLQERALDLEREEAYLRERAERRRG